MPNLPSVTNAIDVSQLVRERTVDAHREAEGRPFIVQLMKGELSLAEYVRYLAQLAYVYEALEARARRPKDPEILDTRLARFGEIESDLRALGIDDWRAKYPALKSTQKYVSHLQSIDVDDIAGYLAHHYTRYLGDLSGGQVIARLVSRHYGATENQLTFYDFSDLGDVVPYKRQYRERLDEYFASGAGIERFLAEVDAAYRFNSAIFDDLAA
jgi:heme oxygenase (biliverdin-producing, ferredoxin)